jgi:bacterioferritin-associated ferredoxin
MLICHCHAVNDRTIRQCVDAGARSGNEIREACGAGGTCGGCRQQIDRLIELHHGARDAMEARASQG